LTNKVKDQSKNIIEMKKQTSDLSSEGYNSNSSDKDESSVGYSDEEKIGPSNFLCHALLGKGSFGEVYLVQMKSNNKYYAMKVLSKDKIMGKINFIIFYSKYFSAKSSQICDHREKCFINNRPSFYS
jgi:hypothetical protein